MSNIHSKFYIVIYLILNSLVGFSQNQTVSYQDGHPYVDLGIRDNDGNPVCFATVNLGANAPEEFGDYYAWGDTCTKGSYNRDFSNYFDTDDNGVTFYKYNLNGGLRTLESCDDAARVQWGGEWRMPTGEEMDTLQKACLWQWTIVNGINGYKITGRNGNSIFLPAAGFIFNTTYKYRNVKGCYWTSSLAKSNTHARRVWFLENDSMGCGGDRRFYGECIRPVFTYKKSTATDLCINEIMISNVGGYIASYDFPDSWVELYNPTSKNISIKGYTLQHKSEDGVESYTFPSTINVPAMGYYVICCDKLAKTYHTSFNLDADGGVLTLFDTGGAIVTSQSFPEMLAPGIGYGRTSVGSDEWQWEQTATLGAQNVGVFTDVLLPSPVFSNQGHVMNGTEEVNITIPKGDLPEDTKIHITLNGKEPTRDSQSASEFHFTIDKSTVIRARLMSERALSQPSVTQSYIFHPRETTNPIISIVTDSDYLYTAPLGLFIADTISGSSPNFKQEWRRPINVEYLGCKGDNPLFNQLGETAIAGGASRKYPQKSMNVYTKERFGNKHFKGTLWADKPSVDEIKSFKLRNGGNLCSSTRINDGMIQMLFGKHVSNVDYQSYRPAILYINGEYRGSFELRERTNEDYVTSNYDYDEDDIEVATAVSYYNLEEEAPSFEDFSTQYHRDDVTYEELSRMMDVDNFMKTFIVECFDNNVDYPHNNVSMWRPKTDGGRWRWIMKDLDLINSVQPVTFNMFKYILGTDNPDDIEYEWGNRQVSTIKSRFLYEKMMSFTKFKETFIDCYSTYLGDFFKPVVINSLIDSMASEISPEVKAMLNVYNMPTLKKFSTTHINKLKKFCSLRPRIVYNQMAEYFALGNVVSMTLKQEDADVKINGVGLTEGDFDGCYFSDRALRLSSGRKNMGWKMTTFTFGEDTVCTSYIMAQPDTTIWLKEYEGCDSVSFVTYAFDVDEFDMKLRELASDKTQCSDWSAALDVAMEEPQYAYANLTNLEALPTSKEEEVKAIIEFYDNNGNYFRKPVILTLQGSSEPKVNLSIQFVDDDWDEDEAPSVTFGNWVDQDEFHLKAFQEDALRGTSEVAYKLYDQMLGITEGARLTGDAFPMSLYVNGNYYGMMAWQLKKHRKNMGLNKNQATDVWLDGKLNDKQLFGGEVNWTKFEVRNPKDLYNMDGTDYDGDNPQEIIDATSAAYTGKKKMERCAEAKQHIKELSLYCNELQTLENDGATAEEMRAAISERFDTESLINYVVFSLVTNNYDGFSDNWQWYTDDGRKWKVAPYDCHLTFGFNDDSSDLWQAEKGSKKYDYRMENALANAPMPWIKTYFWDDIKERYAELRDRDILDTENLTAMAQSWSDRIGEANYTDEYAKWGIGTNCMTASQDMVNHIAFWTKSRLALEDTYLEYSPVADVNGDGRVDVCDLTWLINRLSTLQTYDSHYDINRDGKLNISDIYAIKKKVLLNKNIEY